MYKNKHKGKFIVFEGLDGCGKSTQTMLLGKLLQKKGYKVFLTKEPTRGKMGQLIRKQLANKKKIDPIYLEFLFAADRVYHLSKEIIPALKKGIVVISDRYFLSGLAYGSLNADQKWLFDIYRNFLLPDLTFILKVSPKVCIQRIQKERSQLELYEEKGKLEKIWKNFKTLKSKFKSTYIINGEKEKEDILEEISAIVLKKLN